MDATILPKTDPLQYNIITAEKRKPKRATTGTTTKQQQIQKEKEKEENLEN